MQALHPQYIEKNGTPEFVILSMDEYKKVSEILEDYEDLTELRERKTENNQKHSHDEVKAMVAKTRG